MNLTLMDLEIMILFYTIKEYVLGIYNLFNNKYNKIWYFKVCYKVNMLQIN